MAVYRVVPLSDGTDLRGSWQVKKNGRRVGGAHRKKSAAERKARQKAGPNDSVVIHRRDGTVMPK